MFRRCRIAPQNVGSVTILRCAPCVERHLCHTARLRCIALRSVLREEYEPQIKTEKICGQCGNLFMGHNRDRYCSETCRQRARRLIKRYSNSNILRLHAEANGKRFNPINVLVRDGWRCQLCGKKLKPKHRGTYRDDAPELDHIIPLAQGGEHSKRNTQCACRKCNQKKGSTLRGQLLLFG